MSYRPKNRSTQDVIYSGSSPGEENGFQIDYKLEDFLKSADSGVINITPTLEGNFVQLASRVYSVQRWLFSIEGYDIVIGHCYRSMETYYRLKRIYDERKSKGIPASKPSATSQHFFGEAVDCHLYYSGKRIRGLAEMKKIANLIKERFPGMFLQIFYYSWGIHLSIKTDRSKKAGIQRRIGCGEK